MSIVKAVFESLDRAELASIRVKSECKSVRHIDFGKEPAPRRFSSVGEAGGPEATSTKLVDYSNIPVPYNGNDPFSQANSYYGFFEPKPTTTRLTVQLDSSEIKSCLSLLKTIGGKNAEIVSD